MSPVATGASKTSHKPTWLAIRRLVPFHVMGEGPLDIIVWMDAASGLVLGFDTAPKKEANHRMELSLVATMTEMQGMPAAIAFENPSDEEALAWTVKKLGMQVTKFLGTHQPMVDELMRTMLHQGPKRQVNYLAKKGVEEADVAGMCRASTLLWRSAPWTRLSNDDAIEITLPDNRVFALPMGECGMEYGLVICDTMEGVDLIHDREDPGDYKFLYFGYGSASDFTTSLVKRIRQRGWEIVSLDQLPLVLRSGHVGAPGATDIRLATAVAETFAAYDVAAGGTQTLPSSLGTLSLKRLT